MTSSSVSLTARLSKSSVVSFFCTTKDGSDADRWCLDSRCSIFLALFSGSGEAEPDLCWEMLSTAFFSSSRFSKRPPLFCYRSSSLEFNGDSGDERTAPRGIAEALDTGCGDCRMLGLDARYSFVLDTDPDLLCL